MFLVVTLSVMVSSPEVQFALLDPKRFPGLPPWVDFRSVAIKKLDKLIAECEETILKFKQNTQDVKDGKEVQDAIKNLEENLKRTLENLRQNRELLLRGGKE